VSGKRVKKERTNENKGRKIQRKERAQNNARKKKDRTVRQVLGVCHTARKRLIYDIGLRKVSLVHIVDGVMGTMLAFRSWLQVLQECIVFAAPDKVNHVVCVLRSAK